MKPSLSFVVPVFRGQETLKILYHKICHSFENRDGGFEIIFVEDFGCDGSWDIISALAKDDRRVKGIRLIRNYGQHMALLCGIQRAVGATIITLDDDLEHDPASAKGLLEHKGKHQLSLVYATPLNRSRNGFFRLILSHLFNGVFGLICGVKNSRHWSSFRAFDNVPNFFTGLKGHVGNIDLVLCEVFVNVGHVDIPFGKRSSGRSGYSFRTLLAHAWATSFSFSLRPMRILTTIGFLVASIAFVLLAVVLVTWLLSPSVVPGFTFLASVSLLFSGIHLLGLGAVGHYVSNIERKISLPVAYVVKEETEEWPDGLSASISRDLA